MNDLSATWSVAAIVGTLASGVAAFVVWLVLREVARAERAGADFEARLRKLEDRAIRQDAREETKP